MEILKRENYECFYCRHELQRDDFYLDHLVPRTEGGQNYKSNLVASCRTCNTKKQVLEPESLLLNNYRKGLLSQEEYESQKEELTKVREKYKSIEHGSATDNTA
jgi:5-methylcytosine-specific restriction endonuclease McrA